VIVSLWNVRRLASEAGEMADPAWLSAADRLTARLGLAQTPRLLISPRVDTPMAGGLWRHVVFLPQVATTWSAEYRDVVLSHEMAHAARRDPLWHVMVRLSVALYWFHPLAWIAARQARAAQEQACDAAVLALGTKPSVYARVLMHLAEPAASTRPLAAVPMAGGCFLETRIMAILESGTKSHRNSRLLLPVAAVVLSTLAVGAATPDSQASRAADPPQAPRETASRQAAVPVPTPEHALSVEVAALREQVAALRGELERSRQYRQAEGGEIAALRDALEKLRGSSLARTEREVQLLAEKLQRLVKP
jgi:hypothetical protein